MSRAHEESLLKSVLCGLLAGAAAAYVPGLLDGFLKCFGWLGLFTDSNSLFRIGSVWFYAVYPRFSVVIAWGFPVLNYGLSPLSLCLVTLVLVSLTFAWYDRPFAGSLVAFFALMLGSIQFLTLASLTGFEPVETGLDVSYSIVIQGSPVGLLLYQKNTVPLIVFEALLAGSLAAFLVQFFAKERRRLKRVEAPSVEHFRILGETHLVHIFGRIILTALLMGILIFYDSLVAAEYPTCYAFMSLLNLPHKSLLLNWIFLSGIVFITGFGLYDLVEDRMYMHLAEAYKPLIEEALRKKPILTLGEVKGILGVEEAGDREVKHLLEKVRSLAGRTDNPQGTYKYRFIYAIKPLVQRAMREIEERGVFDLNSLAQEESVPQELVATCYGYIIRKRFMRGVRLRNGRIEKRGKRDTRASKERVSNC